MTNNLSFDDEREALVLGNEEFGIIIQKDGLIFIKGGKEKTLEEMICESWNLEYAPVIYADWIKIGAGITERWGCSNCMRMPLDHDTFYKPSFPYCPKCGAKIRNPRKDT